MKRPSVSFIIATCNRGKVLIDCLQRTLHCGLPAAQFDIRIIDNHSTDNTLQLLQPLLQQHPNLHLTPLPKNAGPVAKNLGLHHNPADFLVLLDDDAYPMPGSTLQMLRHFQEAPQLGAAVFDVTLPDGTREASAYPDVFIGAGTALRAAALRNLKGGGYLPADYFMQAEEYDLSFRLLDAGWHVQRFWDMPLTHLKSPGARIGQRTTRLDVRNNLYLLASQVPAPLCHELAADWLARYWRMALRRDEQQPPHPEHGSHKAAFLQGAAEGLAKWSSKRRNGQRLRDETVEKIFKFDAIGTRMVKAKERHGLQRIAFADLGKNMLPYTRAADHAGLDVLGIIDDQLGSSTHEAAVDYRGWPVITMDEARTRGWLNRADALVLTTISPVHTERRLGALRRVLPVPVIDLFSRRHALIGTVAPPREMAENTSPAGL